MVYFVGENFKAIYLFTTLLAIDFVVAVIAFMVGEILSYNFSICGRGNLVEIVKEIPRCVVYMYLCGWSRLSIIVLSVLGGVEMICKCFFLLKMDQKYISPLLFCMLPSIIGAGNIPFMVWYVRSSFPFSRWEFLLYRQAPSLVFNQINLRLYDFFLMKNSNFTQKVMHLLLEAYNFCMLFYTTTIAIQNLNNEKNSKIDNDGHYIYSFLFQVHTITLNLYLWHQWNQRYLVVHE